MHMLEMADRMDEFFDSYKLPEKQRGSLRFLASMAWVLGIELKTNFIRRMIPGDIGVTEEYLPHAVQ